MIHSIGVLRLLLLTAKSTILWSDQTILTDKTYVSVCVCVLCKARRLLLVSPDVRPAGTKTY